jgi:4-hydroxy-4-methyl-2-oxoglutarate aldolase
MYRVNATIERPDAAIIARYLALKFEIVSGLVPPAQRVDPAIRSLASRDWLFAGPAITVAPQGTDSLPCVAAIGVARPGDVILVAAGGDCGTLAWGGGLTLSAEKRGCAGIAVDGAVIDSRTILQGGLPVFCRASTLGHPVTNRPGSVNVPVLFGGVTVSPGDLVLGDLDGILIVPKADISAILAPAEARRAQIQAALAKIEGTPDTIFDLYGGKQAMIAAGMDWIE